jgi:hypothetical protein
MTGELDELQRWYESQCDGDWEHTYGIKIGTLDNPGWLVDIELADTDLEQRSFASIKNLEPERDWILCEVVDGTFRGRGGPTMLTRIVRTFLDWARREQGEISAHAV